MKPCATHISCAILETRMHAEYSLMTVIISRLVQKWRPRMLSWDLIACSSYGQTNILYDICHLQLHCTRPDVECCPSNHFCRVCERWTISHNTKKLNPIFFKVFGHYVNWMKRSLLYATTSRYYDIYPPFPRFTIVGTHIIFLLVTHREF